MSIEIKQNITSGLKDFQKKDLFESSISLFKILGYNTDRQQKFDKPSYLSFKESFVNGNTNPFNEKKAWTTNWKQVHLLFQLTKTELVNQGILFDTKKVDNAIIEAYLFFAIELDSDGFTRTHLSEITREINKLFPMPVLVLFKTGSKLTLSVINRRLHKKNENKDVLEKITLIKDIDLSVPHRGHIEILFDLSFQELYKNYQFDSFISLHNSWQKTLDTNELNKKFYQELANWYFWAIEKVEFPDDVKFHSNRDKDKQIRNSTNVIRLITRLIFTWFLKEKELVPNELFDEKKLKKIINNQDKTGSTYYKAILQNLFFSTLNTPMNADVPGSRKFIKDQHLIHTFYRYERFFIDKEAILKLFENIPFLNGGLFECLDRKTDLDEIVRLDCFSDNPKNETRLKVPDELFFSDYVALDLNATYQTKNRKYKVRGLINILDAYKFTIHENTPVEEEVALDPELLGKVFENLLASYNPETENTARKQTGSFYTPREVVNYMVDESLLAYFANYIIERQNHSNANEIENGLRTLLNYSDETGNLIFSQKKLIVEAIFHLKVVDPACGSGAFPMGVLLKLVYLLGQVDNDNKHWLELQKQKAIKETETAFNIGNKQEREDRLKEISDTFDNNNGDYGRKLYLIENSIYGVDIQPIAVQIAKLRFFISLIVDQRIDNKNENLGVRPLPNLETKFVAANSLIGIDRPAQQALRNPLIDIKETELKEVREKHFLARTSKTKDKYRGADAALRNQIADLLKRDGFGSKTTEMLANWNPYDQNSFAPFFDMEWMFGLKNGFDIVIGNPPYGIEFNDLEKEYLKKRYDYLVQRIRNSYLYFMGMADDLLKKGGVFSYIIPNEFLFQIYMEKARRYFLLNKNLKIAINTGEDVFEAIVPSCIILIANQKTNNYPILIKDLRNLDFKEIKNELITEEFILTSSNLILDTLNSTFSFNQNGSKLLSAILKKSTPFENYCDDIANGISTSCDSVYLVSDSFSEERNFEKTYVKPCLRGTHFRKFFCPDYSRENVLYITSEFNKDEAPNIYEYLKENKDLLIQKSIEKKKGIRDWYLLFRNRDKKMFISPKIIIRQTGDRIIAAADKNHNYYCINSVHIANLKQEHSDKISFLIAILNSSLSKFIYQEISQESGRVFSEVKPQRIKQMPIIETPFQDLFEKCVLIIEFLVKQNKDSTFFERLLDAMVYEVYLPEAMKNGRCEVLKHLAIFPDIENGDFETNIKVIEKLNKELSDSNHPVCKAIYFMDTIEEISIIEGKKA